MLPDTPDPPQPGAPPPETRWRAEIGALLERASRLMSPGATGKRWPSRAANFLLWSRCDEMSGWGYVYEADIKMAAHLPVEIAVARLETARTIISIGRRGAHLWFPLQLARSSSTQYQL